LVETTVKEKTIELIYKEEPNSNYTYPFATPETQVYKLIYSRFDGSVKREEGIWIEPSEGHYIFD
jgi:hypothetical protein